MLLILTTGVDFTNLCEQTKLLFGGKMPFDFTKNQKTEK